MLVSIVLILHIVAYFPHTVKLEELGIGGLFSLAKDLRERRNCGRLPGRNFSIRGYRED